MSHAANVTVTIDLKKYRVRIHKSVLHLLGDPMYVQLLVDPKDKKIAIHAVDCKLAGDQAHRVDLQDKCSSNSVELYSRSLIRKLINVDPDLAIGGVYRLDGKIDIAKRLAVFDFDNMRERILQEEMQ